MQKWMSTRSHPWPAHSKLKGVSAAVVTYKKGEALVTLRAGAPMTQLLRKPSRSPVIKFAQLKAIDPYA